MEREPVIGCSEAVRKLWEFLDHGLDEHDDRAMQRHLAFCVQCCGEMEFAKELRQLLRPGAADLLPGDVEARLGRFIDGLGDPGPGGAG